MLSYFTKQDIFSQDRECYQLKNGDFIRKSECRTYGGRIYALSRQYFKREIYKQDKEVSLINGELRHIPLKIEKANYDL